MFKEIGSSCWNSGRRKEPLDFTGVGVGLRVGNKEKRGRGSV